MSLRVDIGHGVSIELRHYPEEAVPDLAGKLGGIAWWHPCTGGQREDWITLDVAFKDHWELEQLEPLTISPSALCLVCQFHGHIRGGRWEPA